MRKALVTFVVLLLIVSVLATGIVVWIDSANAPEGGTSTMDTQVTP